MSGKRGLRKKGIALVISPGIEAAYISLPLKNSKGRDIKIMLSDNPRVD